FAQTEEGSASFGRWTLDDAGLPAYAYEMAQEVDPRATYRNTEKLDRRDHWHQVGNRRLTALASSDGVIQGYMGDRGGVCLNRFEAWAAGYTRALLTLAFFRMLQWLARLLSRRFLRATGGVAGARAQQAAGDPNSPRGVVAPETIDAAAQHLAAHNASGNRRTPPRHPVAPRNGCPGSFGSGADVTAGPG